MIAAALFRPLLVFSAQAQELTARFFDMAADAMLITTPSGEQILYRRRGRTRGGKSWRSDLQGR